MRSSTWPRPTRFPVLAEPLYQGLGATVHFMPVMNQSELAKGLGVWAASR